MRSKINVLFFTFLIALSFNVNGQQNNNKIRVERADQFPAHNYKVPGTLGELAGSKELFDALARQLKADLLGDLQKFDIQDRATLQSFYHTLSLLAALEGDYEKASEYLEREIEIESKPIAKLILSLFGDSWLEAKRESDADFNNAFINAYKKRINALPPAAVQSELKRLKGTYEYITPEIYFEQLKSSVEPAARSGSISREMAQQLVEWRDYKERLFPVQKTMAEIIGKILASKTIKKPDIWASRKVSLSGTKNLRPVVVGIWDTGVDVQSLPKNLFVNKREISGNQKDDDKNGFIDDVNGIAFDLRANKSAALLRPVSLSAAEKIEYENYYKGLLDLKFGVESSAADSFKRKTAQLTGAQTQVFIENITQYIHYAHGTHVAGIAAKGNPAARLLTARIEFDYHSLPPVPTVEKAERDALMVEETVEYFKKNNARVVNMSWSWEPGETEAELKANNVGATDEERRKLARRIFEIRADALRRAIASAPQILFVTAAGNSNNDNRFSERVPASIDLPNVLTVGSLDRAGEETASTSYGKVDVYANGYEVESNVPGGRKQTWSGTSMAAPEITNLAAKLLAVKPLLPVAQLRRIILQNADEKIITADKKLRLLNPRNSFAAVIYQP